MFLLAAAAIAASAAPASAGTGTPPQSPRTVVQARATVRILSGARLRLDGSPNVEAPVARETVIRANGTSQPAKLIEFE